MSGPLSGVRVVEVAGIGPVPFAAMLLADLGADVVRVDRPGTTTDQAARADVVNRGKRSVLADLKDANDLVFVRDLLEGADVLLEGMRPGVMERLGLGPDACLDRNPGLIYARMTGWGQTGPLAQVPGHDLNYIAVTGALWAIGRPEEPPSIPLNLLGDYAGGSLFLVVGILAALHQRTISGRGQVVDAAMVEGTAVLTTLVSALRAAGQWHDERGANLLDGAAPYYTVYECADGRYLSVGAIEEPFYADLVFRTGFVGHGDLDGVTPTLDHDETLPRGRELWVEQRAEWAALFRTRTRDEWVTLLATSDACVQPVLDWNEAPKHPQLAARDAFIEVDGILQPAPAPRFGGTPASTPRRPPLPGEHHDEVRRELYGTVG